MRQLGISIGKKSFVAHCQCLISTVIQQSVSQSISQSVSQSVLPAIFLSVLWLIKIRTSVL